MLNAAIEGEAYPDITQEEIAAAEADLEAARIDSSRMLLERTEHGTEILHHDESADTFTIERVQDVEPILDWCRGRYNEGIVNQHCEFRQIASLPPTALDVWARTRGYQMPDGWYLKKEYHHLVIQAAHDRDLSGFRTLAGNYMRRGEG